MTEQAHGQHLDETFLTESLIATINHQEPT
jgi:hypothetical protein